VIDFCDGWNGISHLGYYGKGHRTCSLLLLLFMLVMIYSVRIFAQHVTHCCQFWMINKDISVFTVLVPQAQWRLWWWAR